MLDKRVVQYLHHHRMRHVEKLFELLGIPSISAGSKAGDACDQAANWLVTHMKSIGMEAKLLATSGRPNVLGTLHVSDKLPTLLIYGHYDVQPAEPLELWDSPPFEPTIRDNAIYARGADDNKGQHFAHLMAIEAWQHAGGPPVNIKFFIEGEEEIGSPTLEAFMQDHRELLSAHAAVISDSEFFAPGLPAITYGLRGLCSCEITLEGPRQDLHSGLHGGAVANPINALCQLVAKMHDADGRVTIQSFYDGVAQLTDSDCSQWAKLPFDPQQYAAELGLDELAGGERGRDVLERRWARPTLDANGIVGGHTGPGPKTIIPSRAIVKISMRLVPGQDAERILQSLRQFVHDNTPRGLRASIQTNPGGRAVLIRTDTPAMRAASDALEEAFSQAPAMIRCGASIPITDYFQRILHLEPVLMGFGLPSDNLHSPNEHMALGQLWGGSIASAAFMQNLASQQA